VSQIKLYIDQDAINHRLIGALRSRGVSVMTVLDSGLVQKSDKEQLAFATKGGYALYTFNVSDFHRLHLSWAADGREHAGIILVPQQRYSIGEQLRRIRLLRASVTAEGVRNRVEFLSNWC